MPKEALFEVATDRNNCNLSWRNLHSWILIRSDTVVHDYAQNNHIYKIFLLILELFLIEILRILPSIGI